MERKYGNEKSTRCLYERFTGMPLRKHKMKALFVKWLDFEKSVAKGGNEKMVKKVKEKATEYVNRIMADGGDGGDSGNEGSDDEEEV